MKVSGTSAGSETSTPPMKKLKQARLPFQVITPDAAKAQQETKKRKLSEEREETPSKVVKKSIASEFESDVEICEKPDETLMISDEEKLSQEDVEKVETSPKALNPFVSLVDVALKRKLNKKKSPPKKKIKENKTKSRSKKARKVSESVEGKSSENVAEDNIVPVVNVKSDKDTVVVKVDNKENINQAILIEDSNDCEVKHVEDSSKDNVLGIQTKESSENNQDDKQTTSQDEGDKSEVKDVGKDGKKKGKKIISSMKDEGIVELSDGEMSEQEQQAKSETSITNECETNSKSEEQVKQKNLETENNETKQCDESVTNEQQNAKISSLPNDSDNDDEQMEVSIVINSSLSASELDDVDKTADDVSDDAKSGEKKNESQILTTPKSKKSQTSGDKGANSPHTPGDMKKLTPKQIQKKLESTKKQQEREKERQERIRKKNEEKEERNRQRLEKEEQKKKEREEKEEQRKKEKEEKERQKDQEKREREEKEEAKRKEREEKELQKKREREAKEEERRKKELEREEDKRKKELEKEEAELKKKKAAAAFVNFFVPKTSGSKQTDESEPLIKHDYLSNFTKKADMRLAPLCRKTLSDQQKARLDEYLIKQDKSESFLSQIKDKGYGLGCSGRTWPLVDDDVMIVEDELPIDSVDFIPEESHKQKMRIKLLSFSENRRPPYWGTWRRESKHITGRRPFGMDSNILDYECDSDDEWEEEEPGESVGGSVAGSDDEEDDNDYDVDNDFMVPHGYLSEEEAMGEEDEILSPESQKAKLKIMQCEFEKEMKKNTEKLHPRSIGIIWQKADGGKPESCKDSLWDFLINKRILTDEEHIRIQPKQIVVDCALDETKHDKPIKKSRKITDDMTPDLIKLVHGNTNNRGFLAYEYQTYLAKLSKDQNEESAETYVNVSKMSIAKKIKEISKWMSCPIEGAMFGKMCWCVSQEILEKYEIKVDLPNKWSYVLTPKKRANMTQITQFLNTEQTNT